MKAKVVKSMFAIAGVVALIGASQSTDSTASGAEGQSQPVTQAGLVQDDFAALTADHNPMNRSWSPTLSAMPPQGSMLQWLDGTHVPEFLGTLMAFSVMAWALKTRSII